MPDDFHLSNFMPSLNIPSFNIGDFEPLPVAYSYSDTQYAVIKNQIEKFQSNLDEEHEVGLLLTNFGQSTLMNVTHIGYEKSVLMIFKGFVNDQPATLIQHINQINFLLLAVPKPEPEKPARRIGFHADRC